MMFFNFIPQLIIVLALAGIIIIFSRKHLAVAEKEKQLIGALKKIKPAEISRFARKYFNFVKAQITRLITRLRISIKNRIEKLRQERKRFEMGDTGKKSGIEAMIEEQKYIKIISQDPRNLFAYHKLGKLYFDQKNYDDAKVVFEQILKIDEKNKGAKETLNKISRLSSRHA